MIRTAPPPPDRPMKKFGRKLFGRKNFGRNKFFCRNVFRPKNFRPNFFVGRSGGRSRPNHFKKFAKANFLKWCRGGVWGGLPPQETPLPVPCPPGGVWGASPPQESPIIARALPPQRPCLAPNFFFSSDFFSPEFFRPNFFVGIFSSEFFSSDFFVGPASVRPSSVRQKKFTSYAQLQK